MKKQVFLLLALFSVFGIALACTTEEKITPKPAPSAQQTPPPAISPTTATPSTPAHAQSEWEKMDHDQRVKYMREVVLPKMRATFAEFDEKKYGRINCKTCHGEGATNETFEMPNAKLPKLPTNTEGFQALMKEEPAMMEFMMKKVKPQMAALLGMPEMDPNTNPKGFGCFNCHTAKK